MGEKINIIAIVGPTASGKTGLAIELAKKFGGEVISADSRQVYRGLDIGTEKVTPEEMDGIPHHLIDIADPSVPYTAQDFKRDATESIRYIVRNGKLPIIAGGTGFWLSALLDNVELPEVEPNEKLRRELEEKSADELHVRLEEIDPARAADIDPNNKRRLIRAIEIAEALGEVPKLEENESPYDACYIGIDVPDEVLRERIDARLEEALKRGLLEETKKLMKTLSPERIDELGLEYRICAAHLRGLPAQAGEIDYDEMVRELKAKVWQYAKRQKTWFKRDKRIRWVNPQDTVAIEQYVENSF